MYPKDKKTAAMMSETIRDILVDEKLMEAIMSSAEQDPDFKKPIYWDALDKKNGLSAMVIAQMLKSMAGDTAAFTALSKFGFGEKVQMEISDFYKADRIEIEVVKTPELEENNGIIEGTIESGDSGDGELGEVYSSEDGGRLEEGDTVECPTSS